MPSTSPIVRFSTGFQILRQKVDEWNSVAHKANHMRELEIEIAEYVQRWTKLELQCWRECLTTTFDKVQSKAYRYWFFVYNLLHEYLTASTVAASCDMTDFKSVEKCFGEGEILDAVDEVEAKPKLSTAEVISVLKQYIESANYGEFGLRMSTLKSFEFYLHYAVVGTTKRRDTLIALIHNLHTYYAQFSAEIEESIKSMRTPIEKKLKEFVKIESYNKDLSYFSMKNNIARVHRHLHKFLREFEMALMGKIATVFVWRANQNVALSDDDKLAKGKQVTRQPEYMIDVKHFVASPRLKEKYIDASEIVADTYEAKLLLSRIDKLFGTARNIVKQSILHSQFPGLVYNLNCLLTDQIETCEYLRKLEVDRSQEKPKQKVQAKQILTQKRKALADGFKTLATLGLSFRAGLLETSLTPELVDLKIAPFCLPTTIAANSPRHKKIDENLIGLSENGNLHYARCVFKLKLLQTIMLTPNPELGLPNLERIKGFGVDMFLLVQSQRQALAKSTKELGQLQASIASVNDLHDSMGTGEAMADFEALHQRVSAMKRGLQQIRNVFEQYDLLLRCVPNDEDEQFSFILSTNISAFTKSSSKFKQIRLLASAIMQRAKELADEVKKYDGRVFLTNMAVDALSKSYENIRMDIKQVSRACELNEEGEHMILVRSLNDLLLDIRIKEAVATGGSGGEKNSYENIGNELENIVHHVLLSMQNIYKKYSVEPENMYVAPVAMENGVVEANESEPLANEVEGDGDDVGELIQANHLKAKITQEIQTDLETLNASTILSKLSKIVTVIRHSHCGDGNDDSQRISCAKRLISIMPILEQYELLCKYYLIQQIGAHKISTKMLSVMLTVFIELGAKGFCIPPDLMQDEDGEKKENEDGTEGEGFGLEDGTGENDVSDK